jgi:hypothetical protein
MKAKTVADAALASFGATAIICALLLGRMLFG